jgi:TPR repeat protein
MTLSGKSFAHTSLTFAATLLAFAFTPHSVTAQAQSAQADFATGVRFNTGTGGVTRDPAQAAQWFRKSAEQGYAPGESAYADCLRDGSGVRQDGPAARAWYTKAVAQGNAFAEAGLGYSLERGIGGPQDRRQAFSWF